MAIIKNEILTSEHVFIGGGTGTGKSFLAQSYLSTFPRVWMLDTKGDTSIKLAEGLNPWPQIDPKKLTIITSIERLSEVRTPYLIYEPNMNELSAEFYNEFFRAAYFLQDVTVWIDEAMNVSPNPHSIPEYYKGILTRGRSRKVAAWSLSQRPAGIQGLITSQASHYFIFNLAKKEDRKKLYDDTGAENFLVRPGGHNFWYWKDGMEDAVKAQLTVGKGGAKSGR